MQTKTTASHQISFLMPTLGNEPDPRQPFKPLADRLSWSEFERAFGRYYSEDGRPVRPGRADYFCDSTVFGWHSMYVFMVSVSLSDVVWSVSPTTCGSAPFSRCNPRLLRRADTLFAFVTSHTV